MRQGRLIGAAVLAVLGAQIVTAGCGQTERSPGEGQGSAGEAGEGSPGPSTAGKGPVGVGGRGVAGSVGVAGEGGVAGTFGYSGDAGAGAGAPGGGVGGEPFSPPPAVVGEDCNGNALELDAERLRQCVLLVSCAGQLFSDDVSLCLRGDNEVSFYFSGNQVLEPWRYDVRRANCLGELRTCDDVLTCLGSRVALDECAPGQVTRCEGERAITCGTFTTNVIDCQKTTGQKGACQVLGDGETAHAECIVDAPCGASSHIARCQGDVMYQCDAPDLAFGVDCGQFGLGCNAHGLPGGAVCVARAVPEHCAEPASAGCDGSFIRACSPGGELFERDCSRFGPMVCIETSGDEMTDAPWFTCVPQDCYAPFDQSDHCNGDDLVVDVDHDYQHELRVHCPDYGFATCGGDGQCVH